MYGNRYCNQDGFSVLVCGGKNKNGKYLNRVLEVKVPSFQITKFASMVKPRYNPGLVVVNSDVMTIGGDIDSVLMPLNIHCSPNDCDIY